MWRTISAGGSGTCKPFIECCDRFRRHTVHLVRRHVREDGFRHGAHQAPSSQTKTSIMELVQSLASGWRGLREGRAVRERAFTSVGPAGGGHRPCTHTQRHALASWWGGRDSIADSWLRWAHGGRYLPSRCKQANSLHTRASSSVPEVAPSHRGIVCLAGDATPQGG